MNLFKNNHPLLKSLNINALMLAGFTMACVLLLTAVHYQTKDRIKAEQIKAELATLNQIFPKLALSEEPLKIECKLLQNTENLTSAQARKAYVIFKQGQIEAMVIHATAPDGYNGRIRLAIGFTPDAVIAGVRVIQHQETPGLGDKIEIGKSQWITSFSGLSQDSDIEWSVKKDGGDFDAFTGATITPRAVIKSVHNTLISFNPLYQQIQSATNCTEQ